MQICKAMCVYLHCHLVQILIYIDDSCLWSNDTQDLSRKIEFTLEVLQNVVSLWTKEVNTHPN